MDRELVIRARDGDREAFSLLLDRCLPRMFGAARLILRHDEYARDAVQDASVGAWRGMRALRDIDRFEPWLHRLLVRACYRIAHERRARDVREIQLVERDGSATSDAQHRVAIHDALDVAMHRLSADQRAVIVARFYWGLSLAECATVLGVPFGTIQSRLHRATQALRAAVDAEDRAERRPIPARSLS